jgi:hypothetical protein
MTKQEARRLLILEARVHKQMDYTAEDFKVKLEKRTKSLLEEDTLEAYDLINDELVHILAWVWGWE